MAATTHEPFSPEQRRILLLTFVPLFMSLLGVSIVNVILPVIADTLDAGPQALQWILSGYALAFGIVLVAAGRAGDIYGRGRLFMAGLVLFGGGSLVAGLAPGALMLNAARVVMGLGAGFLNPQGIGLVQQYFAGDQRGRAFGLFGAIVGVSVAIGPVLGGVLVALFGPAIGWRAAFLVNVPIAVFGLFAAWVWLPASAWRPVDADGGQTGRVASRRSLDPAGVILLGLATLGVMLPFLQGRAAPGWLWLALPAGLALGAIWVRWERAYKNRGREPMVDLALFGTGSFVNGLLLASVYFVGMTSIWVVVALYFQQGLGHSPFEAGLVGLPSAVCSAISAPLAGRHIVRVGRPIVLWGIGIAALGLLLSVGVVMLHARGGLSEWYLLGSMACFGIGQGMIVSPNQTLTLARVPIRYAGSAGGVLQTGQRIGTAIGIAAITGLAFSIASVSGWSTALAVSLATITGVILLAGVVGVIDLRQSKKAATDRAAMPAADARLSAEHRSSR